MNFGPLTTKNVTLSQTNLSLQIVSSFLYVKRVELIWTAVFHNAFYLKMLLRSQEIFHVDRRRILLCFFLSWNEFFLTFLFTEQNKYYNFCLAYLRIHNCQRIDKKWVFILLMTCVIFKITSEQDTRYSSLPSFLSTLCLQRVNKETSFSQLLWWIIPLPYTMCDHIQDGTSKNINYRCQICYCSWCLLMDCDAQHTITFKRKNTKAKVELYNIQVSV